jgi:hypothetical protein
MAQFIFAHYTTAIAFIRNVCKDMALNIAIKYAIARR